MSATLGRKSSNPKRQPSACRRKIPCAICQLQIVDGKDEALFCESNCQLWYHRSCASVPPERYKELFSSDEPFVYLSCTVLDQRRKIVKFCSTVSALREELKKVSHMQESSISATKAEVTQLKQILNNREQRDSSNNLTSPTSVPMSYTSATAARSNSANPHAHHN